MEDQLLDGYCAAPVPGLREVPYWMTSKKVKVWRTEKNKKWRAPTCYMGDVGFLNLWLKEGLFWWIQPHSKRKKRKKNAIMPAMCRVLPTSSPIIPVIERAFAENPWTSHGGFPALTSLVEALYVYSACDRSYIIQNIDWLLGASALRTISIDRILYLMWRVIVTIGLTDGPYCNC